MQAGIVHENPADLKRVRRRRSRGGQLDARRKSALLGRTPPPPATRAGDRTSEGGTMTTRSPVDWAAVIADPRFQRLRRRKSAVLWGLMAFSVVYYFALPVGAAYFQPLFRIRVWGVINVGLVFALSEFIVAWGIAYYYSRVANREFDRLAAEIAADFGGRAGR
jgi:uncharacterized membrane protein (DUF485 family)